MNFLIKKAAFFSLLVLTLIACEKPGDIGLDIKNPGQSFGVLYTDTVTVQTSTVLVDSIRTSRASDNTYLLSGQYADPQLGTVTAKSFFQFYPATETINLGESPSIDSIALFLRKSYVYGDTNTVQSFTIHLLQDSIQSTRLRPYYNKESLRLSTAVGRAEYSRLSGDTLKFILNPSVGNQLIALNGQGEDALRKAFFGFALLPEAGSTAAVIGFNASNPTSRLRLYYRNASSQTQQNVYDFGIDVNYTFNQLTSSENAPWNNLVAYQPVPSSATFEETVVEGGIGLMTKINIPHLLRLTENKTIRLNQAYLMVEPVQSKTGAATPPPAQLILYRSDANGRPLRNKEGIYVPVEEYSDLGMAASPRISSYNAADKLYRFNITQYLQRILEGREVANATFYLSLPSFSLDAFYTRTNAGTTPAVPIATASSLETSVSRLILGNQQHPTNKLKLQIYYTEIK